MDIRPSESLVMRAGCQGLAVCSFSCVRSWSPLGFCLSDVPQMFHGCSHSVDDRFAARSLAGKCGCGGHLSVRLSRYDGESLSRQW